MKPLLIYLDQNKWIDLTRAYHNLPKGAPYRVILEQIQTAIKNGTAICPLSASHVIETRKVPEVDHRKRVAQVMVEVSQGWIMAPADYVVPKEMEVAIAKVFRDRISPPPSALGRGIPFAFNQSENLHLDLGISKVESERLQVRLDTPKTLLQFLVGHDESINLNGVSNFTNRSLVFVERIEKARQLGRNYSKFVRKRAYVANLTFSLQTDLQRILDQNGKTIDDFLDIGKSRLMSFFGMIPTLDVEIELATERDDFWNRQIDPNDMADIGFLSVAIPYCDIVVTERFWCDLAKRKKLDQKYNTILLNDVLQLEQYLGS